MAKPPAVPGRLTLLRPGQKSLWTPSPQQRLTELARRKDFDRLIKRMPVLDLYKFIQDLGLSDAELLLEKATGDQIRRMTDLEVWKGEALDPARLVGWLEVVLAATPERILPRIKALDRPLLLTLMSTHMKIWINEEERPPELEGDLEARDLVHTPDDLYLIEFTGEPATVDFLRRMLDQLYREDLTEARLLLDDARGAVLASEEEDALRLAQGRLEEVGFVPRLEALALYQPLPHNPPVPPRMPQGEGSPSLALVSRPRGQASSFLAAVLEHVGKDADPLAHGLVFLCNKLVVAEGWERWDQDAPRRAADIAIGHLGLGLELMSDGDTERAAQLVTTVHPEHLFRVGHTYVVQFARAARRRLAELSSRLELPAGVALRPDPPDDARLAALEGPRPQVLEVTAPGKPPTTRPFRDRRDIEETTLHLHRLAAIYQFLFGRLALGTVPAAVLSEGLAAGADHVTPTSLLLTALARQIVGGAFTPAPLEVGELRRFLHAARGPISAGELRGLKPELLGELRRAIEGMHLPPAEAQAVDQWITHINDLFVDHYGGLDAARSIEVQFVGGPLLLRGRREG